MHSAPVVLGLLGQDGFGPIVIVPPFAQGVDVTFLAAGVAMVGSAERANNPSAVRVPVALSAPRAPGLVDLLLGLNAGILPNATEILAAGRDEDLSAALDHLAGKFSDPAAAVLGAVFLARFACPCPGPGCRTSTGSCPTSPTAGSCWPGPGPCRATTASPGT